MTKKTNSEGKTLEEANNINKSLMVLGEWCTMRQNTAIVTTFFSSTQFNNQETNQSLCKPHRQKCGVRVMEAY